MRIFLGFLVAAAALISVTAAAPATVDTFDFAGLTPVNGSSIAYADWYNAGGYVRFTVRPDPSHPCSNPLNIYYLEVNGQRVGRFSQNDCSTTVHLPGPGRYSWRPTLYVYDQGLTVTPQVVTSFTVLAQPAAPPPPPVTTTPAQSVDTTKPLVRAIPSKGVQGLPLSLTFQASDNSGYVNIGLGVFLGQRRVFIRNLGMRPYQRGVSYHARWTPTKAGRYRMCVLGLDRAGNQSNTSCAVIAVSA